MTKPKLNFTLLFLTILLSLTLIGCHQQPDAGEPDQTFMVLEENPVQEIALSGPASEARAEISGMAWCGDDLILLPQYPHLFTENDIPHIFSISRTIIDDFISGENTDPIEPEMIPFHETNLASVILGFEGFEAIAFAGNTFYVTIEASPAAGMMGYLATGEVQGDCEALLIDADSLVSIEPQANLGNMSDEMIVLHDQQVYTFYEANGINVNPDPVSHRFSPDLSIHIDVPLDSVEYRLTDATAADETGFFWAINYFFPGDTKLQPGPDSIALSYGLGLSHQDAEQVERLVAYQITEDRILLADLDPIYLTLTDDEARNWEGLVQYGDGFLLVTDKYPSTILGFVGRVKE